jgi:hypothetical protein
MTTPKTPRKDGGPDSYECPNCANEWPFEKLTDMVRAGASKLFTDVPPAGECPTCGALCYPADARSQIREDHCAVCGKLLGVGVGFLHVGLCEDCRDATTH